MDQQQLLAELLAEAGIEPGPGQAPEQALAQMRASRGAMGQQAAAGGARVGSLPVEALAGGYMDVAPIHAAGKLGLAAGRALMSPVGRGAVKTGIQGLDTLLRDTRGGMEIPPDLPAQWRKLLEKVAGGAKEAGVPAPAARTAAAQLPGVSAEKAVEMLAQPAKAAGLDPSKPKVFWNVDRGQVSAGEAKQLFRKMAEKLQSNYTGTELARREAELAKVVRGLDEYIAGGKKIPNSEIYFRIHAIPAANSSTKAFREALMDLGIAGVTKGDKKHLFDAFRKAHR